MSPRANDRGETRATMDDEDASEIARDVVDERENARLARLAEPSTSTRREDARREPLVETFGRLARDEPRGGGAPSARASDTTSRRETRSG